MRLLNVRTLRLESRDPSAQAYAILLHTWGDEEVTFQDLENLAKRSTRGYKKILNCCKQARKDGIDWAWIDTCCIDKTSSAELSEAINSMYAWYRDAAVCYAFLEDVPPLSPQFPEAEFRKARWFTRGWCLQELIAPHKVEFYARDWTEIGTRWSLQDIITDITAIPRSVLLGGDDLHDFSIAQKLSWASRRRTSRQEDEAYCLLGIFDVNMPLIYGEGKKAFRRLLSEILKDHDDYSFLLWTVPNSQEGLTVSAPATLEPELFQRDGLSRSRNRRCSYNEIESARGLPGISSAAQARRSPPQLTSRGLQVQMLALTTPSDSYLGSSAYGIDLLLFTEFTYRGRLVCIALQKNDRRDVLTAYWRVKFDTVFLVDEGFVKKAFNLVLIHLAVGQHDQPKVQRHGRDSGLEMHLVSKCSSTTVNLVRSIPTIRVCVPDVSVTSSDSPTGSRLECLQLDSAVQESLSNVYQPLRLHFRLRRNTPKASIQSGLFVSLWLEAWRPRYSVRRCSYLATVSEEEDTVGPMKDLQLQYRKATDRASCWVFSGRNMITVMVKSFEQLQSVEVDVRERPVRYAVHVTVFEDGTVGQSVSQGGSAGTEMRKRKRTSSQKSEDTKSSSEASGRNGRLPIEMFSDSE